MPSAEDTADERPSGRPGRLELPGRDQPTVAKAADGDLRVPPGMPEPCNDQARIGYIGKRLGRFLISAELGRGGMATVYRARDPHLGRDVAVKVMHGFFAGRVDVEARFRREANAVAAIRHPSILAVYDFAPPVGEEPGYIVSELIEGPSLRQLAEQRGGRISPEAATLITIRVAEALGAAHTAGIVHRDVKPDNVLIDRSHRGGISASAPQDRRQDGQHDPDPDAQAARVVLTDFGVAHVSGMDTMTATGAVLGSPAYMSPEQARGEEVGPPSDVFALGVLMYQLCTGRLPFAGKDPLAVISAILRGDYVRPAKLDSRIGPEWEAVITRCLARQAAARFPNGAAVAHALRGLLASAGIADEQAALRQYLVDPARFAHDTSPEIAARALAAAEQARRRRQIPRALAEVDRALAYAPDDPAARALLARLGARDRTLWVRASLVTALAATFVIGFALTRPPQVPAAGGSRGPVSRTVSPPVLEGSGRPALANAQAAKIAGKDEASTGPVGAAGVVVAPAAGGASPVATAPSESSATGGAASGTRAGALRRDGRTDARQASVAHRRREGADRSSARLSTGKRAVLGGAHEDRAVVAGLATGAIQPSPELAPAAPAVPAQAQVAASGASAAEQVSPALTASVVLRASHGFCEPSLDAHPPSLRASYNDLAPGPHEIFCTLPQGGGKVHVATYHLRPGTRPSLSIVPGPGGRPVLSRPE